MSEPEATDVSQLSGDELDRLARKLEAELDSDERSVEEKLKELREKQRKRLESTPGWYIDVLGLRWVEREFWEAGCLLSEGVRKHVRETKGFMSAEGKLLDYTEWHTFVMGFGFLGLSYLVSPWFMLGTLQILRRLGQDAKGSVGEAVNEVPYFVFGNFMAYLLFDEFLGLALDSPGVVSSVARAVLGV